MKVGYGLKLKLKLKLKFGRSEGSFVGQNGGIERGWPINGVVAGDKRRKQETPQKQLKTLFHVVFHVSECI